MEIVKLLEYSQFLRHKYLETLDELPWEEVVKDRGASFSSIRDIYMHCVSALNFYVNYLLQGDTSIQRVNLDDINSIEMISNYLQQVEDKVNNYLSKITLEELSRKIERKRRDGSTFVATVEDYLFDFFQEETHHRGELIALLWQMDVNPPHMGWTQYLNK